MLYRLVPDDDRDSSCDSAGESSEYDNMFARLSLPAAGPKKRSAALQKVRAICGADNAQSNSFLLCSMLLERKN